MSAKFAEVANVVAGFNPVNMATAANNGDWVNMERYERCVVLLFKDASTAGDDPTLTLQQATSNAGANAKNLLFDTIWVKQDTTLAAVGTYTKVTQTAATSYTDATSAEDTAIWIVEIRAEDLDVSGGFTHVQASVADTGTNAQLGALLYIMLDPKYTGGDSPPTAID